MKTKNLATLLVVAPAGTLHLATSGGPGPKLAKLLSGLAGGASATVRTATSSAATNDYPVGVCGEVKVLDQVSLPITLRIAAEPAQLKVVLKLAGLPQAPLLLPIGTRAPRPTNWPRP